MGVTLLPKYFRNTRLSLTLSLVTYSDEVSEQSKLTMQKYPTRHRTCPRARAHPFVNTEYADRGRHRTETTGARLYCCCISKAQNGCQIPQVNVHAGIGLSSLSSAGFVTWISGTARSAIRNCVTTSKGRVDLLRPSKFKHVQRSSRLEKDATKWTPHDRTNPAVSPNLTIPNPDARYDYRRGDVCARRRQTCSNPKIHHP